MPLKHGEAGATPVDASNEDVAQADRAPASEAGSHRFDPPHLHPNLQVAKWEGVGLQNRLFVGSTPTTATNAQMV